MNRRCRDAGLRDLEFRVTDGFTLTIPRLPTAVSKTPEEGLGEKLGKTRAAIVKYMMNDPKVTVPKLAELLSMSTTAVEKNIQYLKFLSLKRLGTILKETDTRCSLCQIPEKLMEPYYVP